jgi:hypothetical protein
LFWFSQDYEGFDEAVENDRIEEFLKLPRGSLPQVPVINHNLFGSRDVSVSTSYIQLFNNHLMNCVQVSMEKEIPQLNGAVPSPRPSPEKEEEEEEEEEEEDEGKLMIQLMEIFTQRVNGFFSRLL